MAYIHHGTIQRPRQTTALLSAPGMTNAPLPVSASDLLSQARLAAARPPRPPLQTSSPSVDAAIGGVQYGRITSLQCDAGTYGTLLAYHIVASYLLAVTDEGAQAAYVDATGAFSPVTLLQVLMRRIILQQTATQAQEGETAKVRERAAQLLDRVQYMRAFDFDGVVEAIDEVAVGIQTEVAEDGNISREEVSVVHETEERPPAAGDVESSSEGEVRSVIPDSLADSDEEILWPLPPGLKDDPGLRKERLKEESENTTGQQNDAEEHTPLEADNATTPPPAKQEESKRAGLLVIDSIPRPVEELLDTNEVTAHVALMQLSRKLRSLAQDREMAILLLSSPVAQYTKGKEQRDVYARDISIFAGIKPIDRLVRTLDDGVDMSIMVSRYTSQRENRKRRSIGPETFVVEVLSQRYGNGAQQWGAFSIKDGVQLVDIWPTTKEDK
ncbi:hypothetical protein Dda_6423 [Drechslerella dactyloides]|uniref:DNA recombination and repair protein Rad51-like C-terminal domain-containing protein n=1 Tax=Drechslerella dactyloides TaxID=74499 RepID=A0AAD6NIX1_DREDA|nr:hypothetical protein Dda_6423 [Drechslerella dactyloides]